ncbi:hypothetical protein protein [Babesia ovis]|uniref:DnaK family protein n=1 Tax=Babesia ovis TaxID=5869 RepID=A0A9W5TEU6_BABOV|nr:hypothetical protein protein [Babesia ovis]
MEERQALRPYRGRTVIRAIFAIWGLIAAIRLAYAQHATVGIDWGEEYVEVAIGFRGHKPDILLNDTGSRKFFNAVALDGETRAFDQKAVAKLLKTPSKTVHRSAHIIGTPVPRQPAQEPTPISKEQVLNVFAANGISFDWEYAPYEFAADADGQLYLKFGTQGMVKVEDVAGHFFSYIKGIVVSKLQTTKVLSSADGQPSILAVIAIPCNYTQSQRKAIVYAAESAGINVAQVVHGITAASTMRAFDQAAGNKKILFVDLGSSGVNVGVIEINIPGKEGKKAKGTGETQVNVLSCVTQQGIGGRHHDVRLAEHLRKIFENKTRVALMPEHPNALQKLVKAANKAKIALTIADSTSVSIEGLIRNVDFTSEVVTRQTFDELIGDSIAKLEVAIQQALEQAGGLKMEQLDGVELIGGASRVPAVQAKLTEIVKPHVLGFHLNAEEAVAVGAGYLAAAHNPFFKMRSANIGDNSVHMYEITIVSTDKTHPDAIEKHTPLFKPGGKLQGSKNVVFKTNLDFAVILMENGHVISTFHGTGITEMMNKEENVGKMAQVTLVFMADERGFISVVKRNATVLDPDTKEEVPVEKPKELKDNITETQQATGQEGAATEEQLQEQAADEKNAEAAEKQELKQPVTFDIDLTVVNSYDAFTPAKLEVSKAAIEALNKRDTDVIKRSESKNLLESLIYKYKSAAREQGFQEACDEATLAQIKNMVDEYEAWFDEESYTATLQEFDERIAKIDDIAKPVHHRWSENEARPALVVSTQKALSKMMKAYEELVEKKPYVAEITETIDTFKGVQTWWEDVQKKQEELKPSDDPAFNANAIKIQLEIAKQALSKLQKTPAPKPPKEEKPKEEPENTEEETKEDEQNEAAKEEQTETKPSDEL